MTYEEDYLDRFEPDDFEEYNRNEADDYRHELNEPEGGWPDSCDVCHEPADCCACIPDEVRYAEPATWRVEGREPPMRYCAE